MTIPSSNLVDRAIRQRDLIPAEKLAACHALVIGVGAIGRQVAVQLAAIGISQMTLIDHDVVGVENLAPQGYWPIDIDQKKVDATSALCKLMNPECSIQAIPERFRRSSARDLPVLNDPDHRPVVFMAVDSIETRGLIWEAVHGKAALVVDGRMNAEVLRVLASEHPTDDAYYPTTLFTEAQAFTGSCTARSTVYTANIAAGLMLAGFTKWLRGLPNERDLNLNLLSAELSAQ